MAPKTSSATPARSTRARARTPLPALDAKHSHAYGAQGKTQIDSQLGEDSAEMAQAMTTTRRRTTRRTAASEADTTEPQGHVEPTFEPATHAGDVTGYERNATFVDAAAPYYRRSDSIPSPAPRVRSPERARHLPPPPPVFARSRPSPAVAAVAPVETGSRLATLRVFFRSVRRYVASVVTKSSAKDILIALICFWLTIAVLAVAPAPAWLAERREAILVKMMYNGPPNEWKPVMQYAANQMFGRRIAKLEETVDDLNKRVGLQESGLQAIKDVLPDLLTVRRTENGWEIPEEFWAALADKMSGQAGAPLWDSFIFANQERVTALTDRFSGGFVEERVGELTRDVVTRHDFATLIEENNSVMRHHFSHLLHDAQKLTLTRATDIATNISHSIIEKHPSFRASRVEVTSLAYANYIYNINRALTTTNWFSPGLGARIDPKLTSPTMDKNAPSWIAWLYTKLSGWPPLLPPIAALQDWREAGQCWCAAPSASIGKAQVTVYTPERIYPQRLVVEHAPASGVLDISTAPRQLEVWASTGSVQETERLTAAIRDAVPPTDYNQCGKPPGPNFVCIGTGTYDIHFDNWVQMFPVFVDTAALGLATDKITVRAVTNWGQDWTCLYRLRMVGKRVNSPTPPASNL